jgi:hypothetical protein
MTYDEELERRPSSVARELTRNMMAEGLIGGSATRANDP